MVFGRETPLGGLPTEIETRCPAADAFMDHMAELDRSISKILNEDLEKRENKLNKNRHRKLEFQTGDLTWILRPTAISGPKLQSFWIGPYKVIVRNGDQSYKVKLSHHKRSMVHLDQMKATSNVSAPGEIVELRFAAENEAEQLELPRVHKIMCNPEGPYGMEVLVEWMGQTSDEGTWVELQNLARVPQWLGEFFAVEGEGSTSKGQAKNSVSLPSEGPQASTVDFINDS